METAKRIACSRCQGRLLPEGADGDLICFTCGHIVYATPPIPLVDPIKRMRRPTHGGWSLG
jgi:hypothetical protein